MEQDELQKLTELLQFLTWVIGSGGSVVITSWAVEQFGWFQNLTSKSRFFAMMGISIVLALGGWGILKFVPAETLAIVSEPFKVVAGVVIVYITGQVAHVNDPNRKTG